MAEGNGKLTQSFPVKYLQKRHMYTYASSALLTKNDRHELNMVEFSFICRWARAILESRFWREEKCLPVSFNGPVDPLVGLTQGFSVRSGEGPIQQGFCPTRQIDLHHRNPT